MTIPVIWRWASGPTDPIVISQTREEVEKFMRERGYGVRPEYGKVLELTDDQFEQLRQEILKGGNGH